MKLVVRPTVPVVVEFLLLIVFEVHDLVTFAAQHQRSAVVAVVTLVMQRFARQEPAAPPALQMQVEQETAWQQCWQHQVGLQHPVATQLSGVQVWKSLVVMLLGKLWRHVLVRQQYVNAQVVT